MAGTVYVQSGGRLFAFDVRCASGGGRCSPSWSAPTQGSRPAPIVASGGIVYAASLGSGLKAFPEECGGEGCDPLWTAGDPRQIASRPAVSGDVVWYSGHALLAFSVGCGTDGGSCDALIDPIRPDEVRVSSGPTVADGLVYVGTSDGSVHAFQTACVEGGSCESVWSAKTSSAVVASPVVEHRQVIVASTDGRVYAFATSCGTLRPCEPLWVGRTSGAIDQQPVLANGVVYVTSSDGNLYAFPESCVPVGTLCAPLFVRAVGALPPSPSVWAKRAVFVTSASGTVAAYTVDGIRL
jgi:outer membrane protein assembly factor BamB